MPISKDEALIRLTARWLEQCEMFPMMREEIPLHSYVRANLPHVMKNGLLAEYSPHETGTPASDLKVMAIDESVCKHGYLTRHCDICMKINGPSTGESPLGLKNASSGSLGEGSPTMKTDAEKYRWLRAQMTFTGEHNCLVKIPSMLLLVPLGLPKATSQDEAIDATIAAAMENS